MICVAHQRRVWRQVDILADVLAASVSRPAAAARSSTGPCSRGATSCATWSAPWTLWPRPTARLLTWRRIDDLGAETGSPPLAKFNNERDNPQLGSG